MEGRGEDLTDSGENNDGTFSFDDSDRFDEMSLNSWTSEPGESDNNWRGWKKSTSGNGPSEVLFSKSSEIRVESLLELAAKVVAVTVPFETVERCFPHLPEELQLRIAFWSFPRSDDNIRLYSCLANGHADEFLKGEQLFRAKAVTEPLQIGFHLNCVVLPPSHGTLVTTDTYTHCMDNTVQSYKPAVVFDRGHVTSCMCTCGPSATWCSHIVALCLHRIHQPHTVCLRPPVSESLSKLERNQLQKFSQYLISKLPQQLLPYAQQLLDELLLSDNTSINQLSGAPDPTAGPSAADKTQWWMDEKVLRENVKKMLSKFCGPGPFVLEEVYSLQFSSTAPPTAAEWSNLLRPLTACEPEGMWNLLSIVRELFHHRDPNAVDLLTLLTQECLSLEQIVVSWFCSRSQACGRNHAYPSNTSSNYRSNMASTEMTKHACASFCDELVVLWRLACLDPTLSEAERQNCKEKLEEWQRKTIEKARNARYLGERIHSFGRAVNNFPGFTTAIEACGIDWSCVELERPSQDVYLSPRDVKTTRALSHSSIGSLESVESDVISLPEKSESSQIETETLNSVVMPIEELDEDINVLCARVEALQIHGYPEASSAAVIVAEKILAEQSLETEEGRVPEEAQYFLKTSLVRATFLCSVLSQDSSKHHLAFRIGIFGLEVPRQPAKSKALEVKLAYKETELVDLLKKLPCGQAEYSVVRERAALLCSETLECTSKAVLPIKLAIFLFQVLIKDGNSEADKELGFKATLSVLKMKADVLETEYPMLCEGTRRQRGELAIALLAYAKDNPVSLQQVKECLLDKKRYCVEKQLRRQRKLYNNKKNKGKSIKKASVPKGGGFGVPGGRHYIEQDVHSTSHERPSTSKAVPANASSKISHSNTDSSESLQSSFSSCHSDEARNDEPRGQAPIAAGDSGRDSESDEPPKRGPKARHVSRRSATENNSDGEIPGGWADHSPGEDWGSDVHTIRDHSLDEDIGWAENVGMFGNAMDLPTIQDDIVHHDVMGNDVANRDVRKRTVTGGDVSNNDVFGRGRNNTNQDAMPHDASLDRKVHFSTNKPSGGWNEEKGTKKGKKGKTRSRVLEDIRSLEAEAHFTFELAKKVLNLAGGTSTSIFSQPEQANNVSPSVCNRSLQLCAFELGLFALGRHNSTCNNWLSRTYSAHVGWISAQALELGSVALTILHEQWEGHLTASEVATIADRASKSNDQVTVQKAAQLALSCLDMAHTLNPGHIQRALTQCKEQSAELLKSACLAVESAARGGGVYPEVLFEVARYWEFLYEQNRPHDADEEDTADQEVRIVQEPNEEANAVNEQNVAQEPQEAAHEPRAHREPRPRATATSHPPPQQQPVVRMSRVGLGGAHFVPAVPYGFLAYPLPTPEQLVQQQVSQQVQHLVESYQTSSGWGQPQVPYQLASAYRVGMLALETLGRRTPDDQPNVLFSRNPPYSNDVRWLCAISNKVGISSLQQFCRASVNAIHSPFVLQDLAMEAAGMMAKSNPTLIPFHLRSPSLSPMVQKCLMKYGQCVQQSLTNLPKSEYPEFVELIMHARGAFCMAAGGMTQFNDLLQSVRRSTSKKKDLWQRITTGLAQYQNNSGK